MANKATHEELNGLHAAVAKELKRRVISKEGTSADLSAAIKFLKDNGVEQSAIPGTPIHDLASSLPFAGIESYPHQ